MAWNRETRSPLHTIAQSAHDKLTGRFLDAQLVNNVFVLSALGVNKDSPIPRSCCSCCTLMIIWVCRTGQCGGRCGDRYAYLAILRHSLIFLRSPEGQAGVGGNWEPDCPRRRSMCLGGARGCRAGWESNRSTPYGRVLVFLMAQRWARS